MGGRQAQNRFFVQNRQANVSLRRKGNPRTQNPPPEKKEGEILPQTSIAFQHDETVVRDARAALGGIFYHAGRSCQPIPARESCEKGRKRVLGFGGLPDPDGTGGEMAPENEKARETPGGTRHASRFAFLAALIAISLSLAAALCSSVMEDLASPPE